MGLSDETWVCRCDSRKTKFLSLILLLIVISFVICCRRENDRTFSKTENDVPVVKSDIERPKDQKRKIEFQEIWQFHRDGWWPQSMLTDSAGQILIPTYRDNKIYVVDKTGNQIELIEFREGQGPGDFSSIEPQLSANGDLLVYDRRQQKLGIIGRKDRVVKKIIKNNDMRWVFTLAPLGDLFYWAVRFRTENKDIQDIILCRYDTNGKLIKEYERFPYIPVKIDSNGQRIYDLYSPYGIYKMDKDGNLYVAFSNRYEIRIYSPEGKLLRKISLRKKPRKTNDKDLANILPYYSELSKDKTKTKLVPPEYMPEIADIHILSDASLLVVTFDPSDNPRMLNADWFSPEGYLLSRQKIPRYYMWFKTFGPGKSHALFDGEYFYSVEATSEAEDDFVMKKYSFKITG